MREEALYMSWGKLIKIIVINNNDIFKTKIKLSVELDQLTTGRFRYLDKNLLLISHELIESCLLVKDTYMY